MTFLQRALSAVGLRRAPRVSDPVAGANIGDPTFAEQVNQVIGALTPTIVANAMREADLGRPSFLIDIGFALRKKDLHMQSVLWTRETAVAALDWEVKPYAKRGKEPTARDKEIAEFVADALENIRPLDDQVASFRRYVEHLNGATFTGFSVAETVWTKRGRRIVPAGFSLLSPRRFAIETKAQRLRWYEQAGGSEFPGIDFRAKWPDCFTVHTPRIIGDILTQEGLIRPFVWVALFRNWDLRDWMQLAEMAWKPWRIGKYDKSVDKHGIANLRNMLEKLARSGVAYHKDNVELNIEWPKGMSTANHKELAEFLAAEMSKGALGQTLTTEQGDKGARALGDVHERKERRVEEVDGESLANTVRRDLVAPLVRMNFGDVPIPIARPITDDALDFEGFMKGLKDGVEAGLRIPASWARDQAGIPDPAEDEEIVGYEVDLSDLDDEDDADTKESEKEAEAKAKEEE